MKRAILLNLAAAVVVTTASRLGAQTPAASASGFSALKGTVIDSLHEAALAKAFVVIEGTDRRGVTNGDGQYVIDSIPARKRREDGRHRVRGALGIRMPRPEYNCVAGASIGRGGPVRAAQAMGSRICAGATPA